MHPSERDTVGLVDMPGIITSKNQSCTLVLPLKSKGLMLCVSSQLINAMHRWPVELLCSGGLLGTGFSWTHCKAELGEKLGVL